MKQERNKPCQCGSGKKYKKCCLPAIQKAEAEKAAERRKAWEERRQAALDVERERRSMPGQNRSLATMLGLTSVILSSLPTTRR